MKLICEDNVQIVYNSFQQKVEENKTKNYHRQNKTQSYFRIE